MLSISSMYIRFGRLACFFSYGKISESGCSEKSEKCRKIDEYFMWWNIGDSNRHRYNIYTLHSQAHTSRRCYRANAHNCSHFFLIF